MMVTRSKMVWLAAAAVAVVQTAALGWMVFERVQLLQNGREIVLPIVPVDPRSLFRGDYVNLSYGVTRIPGDLIPGEVKRGERLYVTIERKADETYVPVAVSRDHPGEVGPDQLVLRGRARNFRPTGRFGTGDIFVHYGIESYFVSEGRGLELEAMARDRKLAAVVTVDHDGKAAIKGLKIDGQLVYEEPLF